MRVFNAIRKQVLKQRKIRSYFAYACGEIILVVFGIFIGLQVNRWSINEKREAKINNYYERISEAVDFKIDLLEWNTKVGYRHINKLGVCLKKIQKKEADSLFKENIKMLTENYAQLYFFPVIDEFLAKGYLSNIKNDSIKLSFSILDSRRKDNKWGVQKSLYFDSQVLKPTLIDKMNYLKIDYYNNDNKIFDFKKLTFKKMHPIDYQKIMSDLEFWNLIVYKISLEKNRIVTGKNLLSVLKKLKKQLKDELK